MKPHCITITDVWVRKRAVALAQCNPGEGDKHSMDSIERQEPKVATAPPTLTKKQIQLLKKPGPFRVHMIVAVGPKVEGEKPRLGMTLVNPSYPGLLHEVAEALLKGKAENGHDFVVEDPRTTRILWTTAGSKEGK